MNTKLLTGLIITTGWAKKRDPYEIFLGPTLYMCNYARGCYNMIRNACSNIYCIRTNTSMARILSDINFLLKVQSPYCLLHVLKKLRQVLQSWPNCNPLCYNFIEHYNILSPSRAVLHIRQRISSTRPCTSPAPWSYPKTFPNTKLPLIMVTEHWSR
jgi:hypothetical protein